MDVRKSVLFPNTIDSGTISCHIRHISDPGSRLDYFLAAASRWVLPKRRRTGGAAAGCGRPRCVWVQVPPAATPMAPARLHAGIHRRRAAGLNADDDATP
ncbi:g5321 [Coccomyxa elongata]